MKMHTKTVWHNNTITPRQIWRVLRTERGRKGALIAAVIGEILGTACGLLTWLF